MTAAQNVQVKTMKAVRIHKFGGPEVLKYENTPVPVPGNGEVLVKVHAAGVNPVDWKVREKMRRQHKLPLTLGWDFSGVVEETGPYARFKKGDAVYGRPDFSRDGAYAEYLAVRDSEIALKPASIDHIHAAGLALAGLTAWQSLFDGAKLRQGQRILIHGASGGVGGFAVQLAKWKGAHVTATASLPNHDFVRSLGADEIIDYAAVPFEDAAGGMDAVLDTVGGETQRRSLKVLKAGGMLVTTVALTVSGEAEALNVRTTQIAMKTDQTQLVQLAGLVDSNRLVVPVNTVYQLSEAADAMELCRAGHARGKIILRVI